MYEVLVEISFRASHQLGLGGGEPEPLHEHNSRVWVELEGGKVGPEGLLVDFVKVKKLLAEIADKLRGKNLGEVAELAQRGPSAENVARYFYEQLRGRFEAGVRLAAVTVEEAPGCWGGYRA